MTSEPNQNKKLFFLVAMPRSGNTLFASIMNQNKDLVVTANSITLEIIKDLFLLKKTDVFLNFPDHKSLDNVLDSVYDVFYKDWPQRIIIDRGPVMTPGNFSLVQKHFKSPFKCIILVRDLMDVLGSYMKWYTENPNAFVNKFNLKNDEEKLLNIMKIGGAVAKELDAIKNAYNYPELCHFVKYDDMVTNPEQEFRKIYKFIGEPYFNHRFQNLNQININGLSYDDTVVGTNMHTVKKEKIEKKYNPYLEKIPQKLRDMYGHIKF
jgi:sulfotransferase|tara:strand:+ start:1 stop:795 length:795 start_codon:yes stop_codon:yes gene_type:complete